MAVSYRIRRSMAFAFAALLLGPVLALAQQVPQRMSYQGTLTEEDDTPLDGTVDLAFAFYDRETGGQPLADWSERYSDAPVRNGRFSVVLGSREGGLPSALFDDRTELWLEVAVDDEPLPRVRLTSTPFAFEAQSVVDGAIDTGALADEAVTEAKLSDDAAVRSLNGQSDAVELTSDDGTVAIDAGNGTIDLSALGGGGDGGGITSVQTTGGLAGGGDSPTVTLRIASGGVTTGHLEGGAVTAPKLSASDPSAGEVLGFDGDDLVWRTPEGGGGGDGITTIEAEDGLAGGGSSSTVTLSLADRGVTAAKLDAGVPGGDETHMLTYEDGDLQWREIGDLDDDDFDDASNGGPPGGGPPPSSIRWKTDVETLAHATDLVARLRGVRYRWKESGEADVGVIAEEVAEVLPELVEFEEDGQARGVHYAKLTAVLVEAFKAQQEELDAKDRALTRQQSEIEAMNDRVTRLERLLDRRADAGTVPSSSAADH